MALNGLRTLLWLLTLIGPIAAAQPGNPVYVDDSPTAAQVLAELPRLLEQGNLGESVSVLQRLLDDEGRRLVPDPTNPDLYRSVRSRVNAVLLSRGALLDRYRRTEEPVAGRLLRSGDAAGVERSYLLTRAGLDAVLILAERDLESARFEAAWQSLVQLDQHPDRRVDAETAERCARLMVALWRYVDRDEVRSTAERWVSQAGLAEEIDVSALAPIEPPASALVRSLGGTAPGPAFSPAGLLPRPLRSAPIAGLGVGGLSDASLLRGERLPTDDARPWVMPVLAGDLVLVNTGSSIGAWDRVTLERRWQLTDDASDPSLTIPIPRRSVRMLGAAAIDDTAGIAVARGVVVGATAPEPTRSEQRDPQLRGLSLADGRLLWSVQPTRLDPELIEGVLHGPPIIVDDTVVINVFTLAPLRRVVSSHLVGLDLFTGRRRWISLLGTSGISPSQRTGRVAPASASAHGVVYRTDPLGLVTATEAFSGRPVWTHRFPGDDRSSNVQTEPWDRPAPIVTDDRVITLSPNQLSVLVLDRRTGELIGRRDASVLGWPRYLFRVGDRLVCVGDRMVSIPLSGVLDDEPDLIEAPSQQAPGRVQVAGHRLLVPTLSGVASVDALATGGSPVGITLDYPGAPVGFDDQLVVVDGSYIHAYLPWATAERVLTERLAQDRENPDLALTYAELAYRAGALDRIPAAADAALAAATRLGSSPRARSARDRLFESLLAMLAADRMPDQTRVRVQKLSASQRRALLDRLGLASSSATQRVGYLMELGLLEQAEHHPAEAAQAYQSILLDPELIEAAYSQSRHKRRAEFAAAEALRRLVKESRRAYLQFDKAAKSEWNALEASSETPAGGPSAEACERLARRYPVARVAPEALLRASELYAARGDAERSLAALESGLTAAESLGPTRSPARGVTGELAGRLVRALAQADRLFAASQVLRRVRTAHPKLTLTYEGRALDADDLERELADRLARLTRLPRVGSAPSRLTQTLSGWRLVEPSSSTGRVPTNHLLLRSDALGVVALFGIGGKPADELGFDPEPLGPIPPSGLSPIWSRPTAESGPPMLIRLAPESAVLLWGSGDTASLEMIDTVSGQTRWRSPPFAELFENEPPRRRTGLVETPLDGPSRLSDLLVVLGERYIALVERTGRAAIFELETGQTAWAAQFDVPVVYEAALSRGILVFGGERPADARAGERAGVVPMMAAYDIPTREKLDDNERLDSLVRWVRIDRSGRVLVGLDRGVVCRDPRRRVQLWTVDDPAVRLSGDAWLLHNRAIVLGPDRQFWQIDMDTGTLRDAPLEDLGRLSTASRIDVREAPNATTAFTTDRGLLLYDSAGLLTGGDALAGELAVLPPIAGDGVYIMLARNGPPHLKQGSLFRLFVLDSATGLLLGRTDLHLLAEPRTIALLDDHVVVGSGSTVLVYADEP